MSYISEDENGPSRMPKPHEWIPLALAARFTPYSPEYLGLLARKKKLTAKKIDDVWYTTHAILEDYMRRQMLRAQVQNGAFDPAKINTGTQRFAGDQKAEFVRDKARTEQIGKIETGGVDGTKRAGQRIVAASVPNIESIVNTRGDFPPRISAPEKIFATEDTKRDYAVQSIKEKVDKIHDSVSGISNMLGRAIPKSGAVNPEWQSPFLPALRKKETEEQKIEIIAQHEPAPASNSQHPTSNPQFPPVLVPSPYFPHLPRAAKIKFSLLALSALFLFLVLPIPVVFGAFDLSISAVKNWMKDSQTVLGMRPGTHANELLVLDKDGNISIRGDIETEGQIGTYVAQGTAPIVVQSTTTVKNLSAEYLDGMTAGDIVSSVSGLVTEQIRSSGLLLSGSGTRVITNVINNINNSSSEGVSEDILNQQLNELENSLKSEIYRMSSQSGPGASANFFAIAPSNRIDNLSNVAINGATIAGSTFSGSISGTDASFSGTLTVNGSASLSGLNISGTLAVSGATSLQGLTFTNATGTNATTTNLYSTSITADSATTTNLFSAIFHATSGIIDTLSSSVAAFTDYTGTNATTTNATSTNLFSSSVYTPNLVATTSATLGTTTITNLTVANSSTSTFEGGLALGTTGFVYQEATKNIGLGTTSPDALLSLLQSANGTPIISAYRITDTAPSGDFINYKTNAGTTLFRVDNSGNLLAGGIVNSGSQTITSASTPQFRVQYDASNEWTASTDLSGNTVFGINGASPSLAFSPQSNSASTFNFTDSANNSILSIDTLNKRVGISTTSPFAKLSLAGSAGGTANLFALSTSTALFATTTALTIDSNGDLALLNGANLTVGGNIGITGNTTLANATTTNLYSATASSTNLYSASASFGVLSASSATLASSTLQNFTYVSATGTNSTTTNFYSSSLIAGNSTTTNLFSTTASSTNLFSTAGSLGTLAVANGGVLSGTFTTPGTLTLPSFTATGPIGIDNVSPSYNLDVTGNAHFTSLVDADHFVATSTTATSTFAGFIDVNGTGANATSTFASNLWVKGTLRAGTGSVYINDSGVNITSGNLVSAGTVTGTTLNGTTGINTGAGAGTNRIDASGNLVNIGTITTSGAINKVTLTAPATGATLTIADGKTLTASNTLTLTATDGSTLAIGTGGTLGSAAYTATTAYEAAGGIAAHAALTATHGVSGAIVGTTDAQALSNKTITASTFSGTSVTDSGLSTGRVTYATTGGLLTDSANLTFNGTTLTAAGFSGPLTGNVTGNVSGTAATVTTAAQPAITSVGTLTGLTMSGLLTWGTSNPNPAIRVRHIDGKAAATDTGDTLFLNYSNTGYGVQIGDTGTDHPLTVYGTITGVGTGLTGTAASLTAGNVTTNANLTGDVTSVGNAATLATVNANVGSFGSSTAIPTFTVNGKGLITAASTAAVIAPAGTLTGTTLAANVVSSSLTAVGTITSGTWSGSFGAVSGANLTNLTAANISAGTAGINISGSAADLSCTNCIGATEITDGAGSGLDADILDGYNSLVFGNWGNKYGHTTYSASGFDGASAEFGASFVQGTVNGPGIPGAGQYYQMYYGLGSDYTPAQYGMQVGIPRTPLGGTPYMSVRFREGGTFGAWSKIYAGYADTVGTNANLTGPITSTGNATAVASQTGTGSTFVMQASPTLTTPNIGAASGSSLNLGAGALTAGKPTFNAGAYEAAIFNSAAGIGYLTFKEDSAIRAYLQWGSTIVGGINGNYTLLTSAEAGGSLALQTVTAGGVSNTSALVVDSTGNVGIGTTDPKGKLDVNGNLSVGYNSGATTINIGRQYASSHVAGDVPNTTNFGLWDSTSWGGTFVGMQVNGVRDGSYNSYGLAFTTHHGGISAGTRMTIDKDGNVGIGTTGPSGLLDIQSSTNNKTGGLWLGKPGVSSGYLSVRDNLYIHAGTGSDTAAGNVVIMDHLDAFKFSFNTNGDSYLNGGDVGIGTTGPDAPLEIYRNQARTSMTGTAFGTLHIDGGDTSTYLSTITLAQYNNVPISIIGTKTDTSLGTTMFFGTSNSYVSGVTNTALAIRYDGNVGIGTTNPSTRLHVYNTAGDSELRITADSSYDPWLRMTGENNGTTEGFTIQYDNSVGDVYLNQVYTGITGTTPAMRFSTGNAANAMVIAGGGNVAIGSTNPGVYKLSITGASTDSGLLIQAGGTNPSWPIAIKNSSGTDLLYMNYAGNLIVPVGVVGIGTGGPDAKLDVLSATEQLRLTYTNESVYTSFTTDVNGDLTIAPSGTDTNITGRMQTSGGLDVLGGNGIYAVFTAQATSICRANSSPGLIGTCTSLRKYKTNIEDIHMGLDDLKKLEPREFTWIPELGGFHDAGFIAEEITAINPYLGEYDGDTGELLGVRWNAVTALAVKAIQELNAKVEERTGWMQDTDIASSTLEFDGQLGNETPKLASFLGVSFDSVVNIATSTSLGGPTPKLISRWAQVVRQASAELGANFSGAGDVYVAGNVGLGGDLYVAGGADVGGDLRVASSTEVGGNVAVGGDISAANAAFLGDLTAGGSLTLSGLNLASTTNRILTVGGDALFSGNITSGNIAANNISGTQFSAGNSGIAEQYAVADETIAVGDIVSISQIGHPMSNISSIERATASTSVRAIGIVEDNAGVVLGSNGIAATSTRNIVSLGKTTVNVTTENGPIHAGDRLMVSSFIAGAGTKATTSSYTVGIALNDFDPDNGANGFGTSTPELVNSPTPNSQLPTSIWTGQILVAVNLSWSQIDSSINGGALAGNFWTFDSVTGRMKALVPIDMNGKDIANISAITSASGAWGIDADGNFTGESLAVAGTVKIGSSERRTGISMYDEVTGEPYCLTVSAGIPKTASGECVTAGVSVATILTSLSQSVSALTDTDTSTTTTTSSSQVYPVVNGSSTTGATTTTADTTSEPTATTTDTTASTSTSTDATADPATDTTIPTSDVGTPTESAGADTTATSTITVSDTTPSFTP